MRPTTRPATEEDREWLFALHVVTLMEHVKATYGWDSDDQRKRFDRGFDVDPGHVLLLNADEELGIIGEEAGAVCLEEREDHLHLFRIEIYPHNQGKGIGTAFLRQLQA